MANLAEFLDKLPILLVGFLMLATMTLTATAGYVLRQRVRRLLTCLLYTSPSPRDS